ncbi:ORC1-type DNA replication protein [Sulfurisphaera ohwakuensis]|uniref:ORC1-type DNA replication protein n=1 Tax=Sulfurisphaera ohwakuensis TaxID=69656 RepID=A0A650CEE1_SULOH|nr:ORC1-type DNA replication protein [Sulfurisphaera ohwakuensis]
MKVLDELRDLVEDAIKGSTVFEKSKVLTPDYIPKNLPHREKQIKELSINFREILSNPGSTSVRVVISGKTGTGKTVTTKKFGELFSEIAKEKGLRVVYTHINCHRQRTLYLMLVEIANQLNLQIPNRGLSSQETFKLIYDYLEKRNIQLIITLDEFDYFVSTSPIEDIYFLVRIYDELNALVKRIHYIFILRELTSLASLDKSIKDHVIKNVIEFPPYTSEELYDILMDRIVNEKAFREGAVLEETVRFISDIYGFDKGGSGNARLALETLELAGKIADTEGSLLVTIDHAKKANSKINPELSIILDTIRDLDLHQLLVVKAIMNLHKKEGDDFFSMGKVEEEYNIVAKDLGEIPRKHTQVFEYIRKLKLMGLITARQSGKGMRGRTTLISLSVPISEELDNLINNEIRDRLLQQKNY